MLPVLGENVKVKCALTWTGVSPIYTKSYFQASEWLRDLLLDHLKKTGLRVGFNWTIVQSVHGPYSISTETEPHNYFFQ